MRISHLLASMMALLPTVVAAEVAFTLDSVGPVVTSPNTQVSLVLDAGGIPQLSFNFWTGTHAELLYAQKTGDAWTIEVADPATNVGFQSSLALDSAGEPHISYTGAYPDTPDLFYATRSRGEWLTDVVDTIGLTGVHSSIAIDSQDVPHISYYTEAYDIDGKDLIGNLSYATLVPGNPPQWIKEYVDEPGDVGLFTSLELDASDNPCISYYDRTNLKLKFARKENGVWTKEVVGPMGSAAVNNTNWQTSLAIDSNGDYHISYLTRDVNSPGYYHLSYAVKSGGVWTIELPDPTNDVGWYSSLALDSQNRPWISYMEQQDDWWDTNLRLATKQAGVWTHQIVDATERTGTFTSIALDSQGLPWIAYHSQTADQVQVAIPNPAAVGVEPFVGSEPLVGAPYPNPSRGAVTFSLQLPRTEAIRLTLFDIGGRMVSRLPAEEIQGGSRLLTWNPHGVESGVYFLRVESSSGIQETRQITMIR